MLTVNEESMGNYEPYLLNETSDELPSTYYLPFIPAFDYSGYLDNMTVSLNATHGLRKIPNIYLHNGISHRALQ